MPAGTAPEDTVLAWDAPTRLFKWALVLLVALAWVSEKYGDVTLRWHKLNGYAVLTLVIFRLLWGVFGPGPARLGRMVQGPLAALRHAADLIAGRRDHWRGHTPLGGWMAAALMLLLLGQGLSGLFAVDSNGVFGGPFAHTDFLSEPTTTQRTLSWLHHSAFNWLLVLIGAHVAVGAIHQFVFKDRLITAMITGRKPRQPFRDANRVEPAKASWWRAGLCLAAAAGLVLGGVKAAGGTLL